jgi:hypothetical protein
MTKINAISPRNTMAISAMLLLTAGTAHAQDVTIPVTDAPVAAAPVVTPAPAAPTIVIPTATPEPVPEPATASTPVAAPIAQPRPAARPAPRSVARESAPAPAPAAATESTPTPVAAPVPAPIPAVASSSVSEPTTAAPVAADVATDSVAPDWALPVGAAATLLVLGGVGLAVSRRRRVYAEDVDFVPPVATRPSLRPQPERRVAPPMPPERPSTPTYAMSAASTRTASEREALIERIVASPPDDANPFQSRKARRRRARIMVQSMAARSEVPTSTRAEQVVPEVRTDYAQA